MALGRDSAHTMLPFVRCEIQTGFLHLFTNRDSRALIFSPLLVDHRIGIRQIGRVAAAMNRSASLWGAMVHCSAGWSSLDAHLAHNQNYVGSNPTPAIAMSRIMVTNTHVKNVQSTCMGCVNTGFVCDGILLQMNLRSQSNRH